MVKLCKEKYDIFQKNNYTISYQDDVQSHFNTFDFTLDDFQKYAIHGIIEKKNVLITAHTGSGKTLPAEFCIEYFTQKNNKVIYTAPIKSLSNQKFYEFKNKFPHIEFGILTGDIKFNPDAQVIIMTTEILRNKLLNTMDKNTDNDTTKNEVIQHTTQSIDFDVDIENEVGCVIFDEVHYINDLYRGHVWEESIIAMYKNIQMLMLSATIDKSEEFAQWIETITNREVWLCPNDKRVIPLTHYSYMISNQQMCKKNKYRSFQTIIDSTCNSLQLIKSPEHRIVLNHIVDYKKIQQFCEKNNIRVHPIDVIQKCLLFLKQKELLPAICFVFSRKKVEYFAKSIQIDLIDDSHNNNSVFQGYVKKECEMIIRNKIPNHQEFIQTIEYVNIVNLLLKGIAIHHSGMIPILKEMVELLFSKGYVKLLFATETFSVGINMPTKTTLFTSLKKFDGTQERFLLPHEYTQMAGRAGRRGLDTTGTVIHLNNLFEIPERYQYETILNGNPQSIQSKFNITPVFILQFLYTMEIKRQKETTNGTNTTMLKELFDFAKHSYSMKDLTYFIETNDARITENNSTIKTLQTSLDIFTQQKSKQVQEFNTYIEYKDTLSNTTKQKQKKKLMNSLKQIETNTPIVKKMYSIVEQIEDMKCENIRLNKENQYYIHYYENEIMRNIDFLKYKGFLIETNNTYEHDNTTQYTLTNKGKICSLMKETNGLYISEYFEELSNFEPDELLYYISFLNTSIKMNKEMNASPMNIESNVLLSTLNESKLDIFKKTMESSIEIQDILLRNDIFFQSQDYELCSFMLEYVENWIHCDDDIQCKNVLQNLKIVGIFSGEFVKFMLKNMAIVQEFVSIAEKFAFNKLLHNLSYIEQKIMKYIVSNQSLYV